MRLPQEHRGALSLEVAEAVEVVVREKVDDDNGPVSPGEKPSLMCFGFYGHSFSCVVPNTRYFAVFIFFLLSLGPATRVLLYKGV